MRVALGKLETGPGRNVEEGMFRKKGTEIGDEDDEFATRCQKLVSK